MSVIEIEKRYLAKVLPDLTNCKSKEIIDIYFPKDSIHPVMRLRKSGDFYEITKKERINDDRMNHKEDNIHLTKEEFLALSAVGGKRVSKIRYLYNYEGRTAEIDVFNEDLQGLTIIEFEFPNIEEAKEFEIPEFCYVDVTHEELLAGGMICGKTYEEIKPILDKFNYVKQ